VWIKSGENKVNHIARNLSTKLDIRGTPVLIDIVAIVSAGATSLFLTSGGVGFALAFPEFSGILPLLLLRAFRHSNNSCQFRVKRNGERSIGLRRRKHTEFPPLTLQKGPNLLSPQLATLFHQLCQVELGISGRIPH
jgi:hypothetical protein